MKNERIIKSRNEREGGYCGKHYICRQDNNRARKEHRRAGPHGWLSTLHEISRCYHPF